MAVGGMGKAQKLLQVHLPWRGAQKILAADDLREAAAAAGLFRLMADDAARKLRDRVTTPAEVLAALGGL